MVQGLVQLILLTLALVGCSLTPPEARPEPGMPADDPLTDSPARSLVRQAEVALEQGRSADAGRKLERALAMEPGSSWLYRLLAEQRLRREDAKGAEGFVRRALRHAPVEPTYYRAALRDLLATSLARQGERAAAERARERARSLRRE
jgi:predicted Zn-dependent protease